VRRAISTAFAFALVGASALACATKVASSTAGPFSTLNPAASVRDLETVDQAHLCLDVQIFAATTLTDAELHDYECVAPIVYAGGEPAFGAEQCQSLVDRCAAIPAGTPVRTPLNFGECGDFIVDANKCNATVGDVGSCLDDLAWTMQAVLGQKDAVCKSGYAGLPADVRFYTPWARCRNCTAVIQYAQRIMTGGPATLPGSGH
jgi:hypothetical protein